PFERQKPPQELQLARRPAPDLHEILRPRHRPAQHRQQDLLQWVNHLPSLPRIVQRRKLSKQRLAAHRDPPPSQDPYESQYPSNANPTPLKRSPWDFRPQGWTARPGPARYVAGRSPSSRGLGHHP